MRRALGGIDVAQTAIVVQQTVEHGGVLFAAGAVEQELVEAGHAASQRVGNAGRGDQRALQQGRQQRRTHPFARNVRHHRRTSSAGPPA